MLISNNIDIQIYYYDLDILLLDEPLLIYKYIYGEKLSLNINNCKFLHLILNENSGISIIFVFIKYATTTSY